MLLSNHTGEVIEGHCLLCRIVLTNPSMELLLNLYFLKPFSIFQLKIILTVYENLSYSRISKEIKNCLYNHLFVFTLVFQKFVKY